jgi:uncharacterized protein (TIGR03437 family)
MQVMDVLRFLPLSLTLCGTLCGDNTAGRAVQTQPAYFEAITLGDGARFVVRIDDPDSINEAHRIMLGEETRRVHLAADVVKAPASYNEPWSFHLDPNSVSFFADASAECDATALMIEYNLESVGGSFLPNNHWCARSSRLLREFMPPSNPVLTVVSAASFSEVAISPESLASVIGADLARTTEWATGDELPTELGGVEVELNREGSTTRRKSRLVYVSPERINFIVPDGISSGVYRVRLIREGMRSLDAFTRVESVAPGLFFGVADGERYANATLLRVRPDGSRQIDSLFNVDPASGEFTPAPIDFGAPQDQLYLSLYGTGFGTEKVSVAAGSDRVRVLFAGAQGEIPGLDQINIALPHSLAGRRTIDITVSGETDDGHVIESIPVTLLVKR